MFMKQLDNLARFDLLFALVISLPAFFGYAWISWLLLFGHILAFCLYPILGPTIRWLLGSREE